MTTTTTTTLKSFVNGEWVASSGTEEKSRCNPADTRQVLYTYTEATWEDSVQAIEAANEAFSSWKNTPAPQRGEYLYRIVDLMEEKKQELAETIVLEEGKTYTDAEKEVSYAAGIVKFYAGACLRFKGTIQEADLPGIQIQTKPEPLGVVLVVTPWNFPLSIPAWKTAPAIASGNTVVLKASSETPLTALKFMEIMELAGVPQGVVNYVIAPGKLVPEMIRHDAVKAVTFTGSNAVGKKVYAEAAKDMKRCLLEMGGKNPLIVMEDADLDEGAKMGPHVNQSELQSTLDMIESAKNEGATVVAGGGVPTGAEYEHGYFIEPTVITNVTSSMTVAQQEIFGPVTNIITVSTIDETIQVANDVDYGLSAAICTKNIDYMNQALNEIEAGIIKVNMTTTGTFFQAPFGGFKQSSTGTYKELGSEALEFYCQSKTRYIKNN